MTLKFCCTVFYLLTLLKPHTMAMEPFIVQGEMVSSITEFPSTAYLKIWCYFPKKTELHMCGGSILNQMLVLTAAHCYHKCDPAKSFAIISVGSRDNTKKLDHRSAGYSMHEDFNMDSVYADIALVVLQKPLVLGKKIKRLSLATDSALYFNTVASLSGWGLVDEVKNITTIHLKKTKQKIWSREKCMKRLKNPPPNTICAINGYSKNENKIGYGAQGDSGSPLIVDGYIQVGIVSYKRPERALDLVVFTDVSKYRDWIHRKSYQMFCRG